VRVLSAIAGFVGIRPVGPVPPPPVDPVSEAIARGQHTAIRAVRQIAPEERRRLEELAARQRRQIEQREALAERRHETGVASWWVTGGVLLVGGGLLMYFLLKGPKGTKNPWGPQTERQARAAMTSLRQYGHSADPVDVYNLLRVIEQRFPQLQPDVKRLRLQLGR
jgi:hypothetical protein